MAYWDIKPNGSHLVEWTRDGKPDVTQYTDGEKSGVSETINATDDIIRKGDE